MHLRLRHLFFLVISPLLLLANTVNAFEVALTQEDVKLLERLDKIDETSEQMGQLLYSAPLLMVLSSKQYVDAVVSVTAQDLTAATAALSAVNTIRACQIKKEIELHMVHINGPRYRFFDQIKKSIEPGC